VNGGFTKEYYKFEHIHWLTKVVSGTRGKRGVSFRLVDIGHGFTVSGGAGRLVPSYEPTFTTANEL
jgi:hypothetical protein